MFIEIPTLGVKEGFWEAPPTGAVNMDWGGEGGCWNGEEKQQDYKVQRERERESAKTKTTREAQKKR